MVPMLPCGDIDEMGRFRLARVRGPGSPFPDRAIQRHPDGPVTERAAAWAYLAELRTRASEIETAPARPPSTFGPSPAPEI